MQEMFTREQLVLVTIGTPSGMHAQHACTALRAGIHVLVEKPIEIRKERIDEMLQVQQESKKKLGVFSQHRFDASSQEVFALAQEGAFGKLTMGNALIPWWRAQKYYDSGAWRGTWELDGGGVLMNQSIHTIDLLQWIMGPVKSLFAYTDTLAHTMETEDVAVAVLRFANGAIGTIAGTTTAYPGTGSRLEIFGDQGTAIIESDKLIYKHLARDEKEGESVGAYGGATTKKIDTNKNTAASNPRNLEYQAHAAQIADMVDAIREDREPLLNGISARHPVDIILGIYESARTQKPIKL